MVTSRTWESTQQRRSFVSTVKAKLQEVIDLGTEKWKSQQPNRHSIARTLSYEWLHSPAYPAFPSPCSYDKLCPVPREIERWEYLDLQACSEALLNGELRIKVVPIPSPDDTDKSTVTSPDVNYQSDADKDIPFSSELQEPTAKKSYQQLKRRLISFLEAKLGRSITSPSSKSFDIRKDYDSKPDCYRWGFTLSYSSFPSVGISRWSTMDQKKCEKALDQGWLTVTDLRPNTSEDQRGDSTEDSIQYNLPAGCLSSRQVAIKDPVEVAEDERTDQTSLASTDEATAIFEGAENTEDPFTVIDNQMAKIRVHASIGSSELATIRASLSASETRTSSQIREIDNLEQNLHRLRKDHLHNLSVGLCLKQKLACASFNLEIEQAILRTQMEEQAAVSTARLSELENQLRENAGASEAVIAAAQQQARDTILLDMQDDRDAQLRAHLAKLEAVRLEARAQGKSSQLQIIKLKGELESLKQNHASQISRAREEGRKEGRDNATSEDEAFRTLLEEHGVNYGRKAREMKTIYSNWNDIPQNILLAPMLPEGRILGDRTLILLAKLSKEEKDPERASTLLQQEVSHRNSQLSAAARNPAVTNADISRVLATLESSLAVNLAASEASLETTPKGDTGSLLEELLASLSSVPTPTGSIAHSTQDLPTDFVRKYIGGNDATFARCGLEKRENQIVEWPEMFKINLAIHENAPTLGQNGALTFVDGRANIGEVGKVYPTLLKKIVGSYQYIGHYRIAKRAIMPVHEWKKLPKEEQFEIASEIEGSVWGQAALSYKKLSLDLPSSREKRLNKILDFFEKPDEPCMRLSWTLLEFIFYNQAQAVILKMGVELFERETLSTSTTMNFRASAQKSTILTSSESPSCPHVSPKRRVDSKSSNSRNIFRNFAKPAAVEARTEAQPGPPLSSAATNSGVPITPSMERSIPAPSSIDVGGMILSSERSFKVEDEPTREAIDAEYYDVSPAPPKRRRQWRPDTSPEPRQASDVRRSLRTSLPGTKRQKLDERAENLESLGNGAQVHQLE
ncbi:MAG: hypothetical protein M1818_005886 [Claussenomyces sp. TS43310]|nr:MAG: hypothetical protein M1818_005886 [Claussenomyces sp. TS43310]